MERGATRLCQGATNAWGDAAVSGHPISWMERGATRLRRGATNAWGVRRCRATQSPRKERGATRLCRGATNAWGVWGAISGPPIQLMRLEDALDRHPVVEQLVGVRADRDPVGPDLHRADEPDQRHRTA